MAHKKRRVIQRRMEEESYGILRNALPQEWVLHQYAPDYGIDLVVETFEYIDEKRSVAETLGEFFFVQLKSKKNIKTREINVNGRYNVEKIYKTIPEETSKIEVIPYQIDIDELLTVQSMGHAVPTILFLVDLETKKVYFICLNDYIEKILIPNKTLEKNKSTVTIYIPISNVLDEERCICHLSFLARRSKLFGAFNKFYYQMNELERQMSPDLVLHFISIIKKYDFWNSKVIWPALEGMYEELLLIEKYYKYGPDEAKKDWSKFDLDAYIEKDCVDHFAFSFWSKLCNLGRIYEEICKEWYLPTAFWEESYDKSYRELSLLMLKNSV